MSDTKFELVQVHENGKDAEIVVRDKNSFKVYAGNLKKVDNPKDYYSSDFFYNCEFCGCNTNAKMRACCQKGQEADRKKDVVNKETI